MGTSERWEEVTRETERSRILAFSSIPKEKFMKEVTFVNAVIAKTRTRDKLRAIIWHTPRPRY